MERPDAKLFQAFEQDVAGLERDVSGIVQGLRNGIQAYYAMRWGNLVPYAQMRLVNFPEDTLRQIGDELSQCAREIIPQLAETLAEPDILTVSMDSGRMLYTTIDESNGTCDVHELRKGQQLRGIYRTLAIQGYLPETFAEDEADDDMIKQEMHPLGLHLLLDNVVIDGTAADDYEPSPHDVIYVPVHYSQLRVSKLQVPNE